ncbi:hypothetical protein BT96DRAFT_1004288 [Gymnopus androsaceus JB14]|uniref:Uncharacterized protein n=1 Tax=Gymnopus androsaceus JB14 TaxID=1447944 RepID=A0A6A4GRE8_9AGAR|nr:hypothetical protein BT96DRAFT_1004288 [Gymnopus androsaceus JB14]
MPCIRGRTIREARKRCNQIYSKGAKNELRALIIAVKKQRLELERFMDDGSQEYQRKVLTLTTLKLQLLAACPSLKTTRESFIIWLSTPATTTPEAPELPQQPHEAGLKEQLQLRQLELIPGESATVLAACLCPDSKLQSSWVNGIWAEEMAALPEDEAEYELTDELSHRETCVRGSSWDHLVPIMASIYPFKQGLGACIKKYNKKLHSTLTLNFGFYYLDPEACTGYMQTDIIVKAVEYYLDQWSTGSRKPKNLDEDVLAPIWVKHMSRVKEWEEINPDKTLALQQWWYKKGRQVWVFFQHDIHLNPIFDREYAGIGPEWLEKPVKMSKEDQKHAAEELRDLRIPKSGDENEGSEDDSDRETDISSPKASALELDTDDNGMEGQGIACDNAHGPGSDVLKLERGDNLLEQNIGDVNIVPANSDSGSLTTGDTPGSSAAVVKENVQAVPKRKTRKRKAGEQDAILELDVDAEVQKALKMTKKQATQV